MKQTIRIGVYETNSSSSHSLSFVEYEDWQQAMFMHYFWDAMSSEIIKCPTINIAEFEDWKKRQHYNEIDDVTIDENANDFLFEFLRDSKQCHIMFSEEQLLNELYDDYMMHVIVNPTPDSKYMAISIYAES